MATHYVPSLLDTAHIKPMDKKMTETFLHATLMESHPSGRGKEELTAEIAKEFGPLGQILWHRLTIYGNAKMTVGAAVVVAMLSEGNPGNLVMYAFTVARLYAVDKKIVDMGVLANAFPMGFPTERGLIEVWDAQKGNNWGERVDNMLDHPELLGDTVVESDKEEWCKWLTK